MGAILVLTPLVISAWPAIAAAVMGSAASMGFSVMGGQKEKPSPKIKKVETEIENSEVLAEQLGRGQKMVIQKDGITIEIGQDERGACTVCVHGVQPERELRAIGEEVGGRIVQQFAYHKLMTELKGRNFNLVEENMTQDGSIQVRVRL
jgi:hypothetical protein